MKYPAIQRRHRGGGEARFSLFPFLAVLICTMGALIFLLVVIARQVRMQTTASGSERFEQTVEELESAKEMKDWYLEELKASKEKSTRLLKQAHARLGHLDDQIARARQEIDLIRKALASLDDVAGEEKDAKENLQAELALRKEELEAAEAELARLREETANAPRSYSVVPYQGASGTFRRPIYLECVEDGIILQPEGISFHQDDFPEIFHPEAPLNTALRAVRQYLRRNELTREGAEAYPLLLVRPSGIEMYYQARKTLGSLGDDFGYELIEEDWPLAFPAVDEELKEQLMAKVKDARRRTRLLARAAPQLFQKKKKTKPVYGVASNGTPVRLDTPQAEGNDVPNPFPYQPNEIADGPLSDGDGIGNSPSDSNASSEPPMIGLNDQQPISDRPESANNSRMIADSLATSTDDKSDHLGATNASPHLTGPRIPPPQPPYSADHSPAMNGETSDESASTISADSSASGETSPFPSLPEYADPSCRSASPRTISVDSPSTTKMRDLTTSDLQSRYQGMPPEAVQEQEAPSLPSYEFQSDRRSVTPLAESRGDHWGLPEHRLNAFGITRPIMLYCTKSQLFLLKQPGATQEKRISLSPSTRSAVEELVPDIWAFMENWGMAGEGMYWKPLLKVSVGPGGEEPFQELVKLLEGSGIEVERR